MNVREENQTRNLELRRSSTDSAAGPIEALIQSYRLRIVQVQRCDVRQAWDPGRCREDRFPPGSEVRSPNWRVQGPCEFPGLDPKLHLLRGSLSS